LLVIVRSETIARGAAWTNRPRAVLTEGPAGQPAGLLATHSNARLEGLNSIFQAAPHRARGYSSAATFIAMIYLLAAPIGDISKSI
jgi:hypothetical protein